MNYIRKFVWVGMLGSLWCAGTQAGEADCGSLRNAYGPYDYTNADHRANKIPIVEVAHFNSDVESLKRGQSSVWAMDDIHYVLRAVPNHQRALASMARYYLNGGQPRGYYSADCYFDRALRFKPEDGTVHLIYGTYLHRLKSYSLAEEQYRLALENLTESADANYDLGLLYADIGRWADAKQYAIVAYRLGYPLAALKHRLASRGLWSETDEAAIAVPITDPATSDGPAGPKPTAATDAAQITSSGAGTGDHP
jgi:tetratricopeptide (TPR) repeat protein